MAKSSCFKILARDKKTKARIGEITTKKGKIETPFFMPVATKAAVKHISSHDLEDMKAPAVISNTFILHLRPGEKIIKQLGGIGEFMDFDNINVTDSGGFQMYSPSLYIKSNEKGVFFKNPLTNEKVFITPEKDMEIQFDLSSEIAMCLDTMPLLHHSKKDIALAVERTTEWAKRCKAHHDKLQKNIKQGRRQLLWGITQGGIHADLRKKSCEDMKKIDFDGFSIGGLALGETHEQEMKMIEVSNKILPENKPRYLMGAGSPVEILEAISRGCDMFDSRFPTQNARRGTLFTSKGKLRILQNKFKLDTRPIDENCGCFVCRDYTRAYIRYQLYQEEAVGMRLASYHNLCYLTRLMEQSREEIKKGRFKEFLKKVKKEYEKADRDVKAG